MIGQQLKDMIPPFPDKQKVSEGSSFKPHEHYYSCFKLFESQPFTSSFRQRLLGLDLSVGQDGLVGLLLIEPIM